MTKLTKQKQKYLDNYYADIGWFAKLVWKIRRIRMSDSDVLAEYNALTSRR